VKSLPPAVANKPVREGVLAITRDETTLDRLEGVIRELQLDDELSIADTPDLALHRIRSGLAPRVVLLDLTDLPAPIAEIGAVRAMGGADLALVGLGTVNDVTLYRDLLAAGANDYLVKPPSRDALAVVLQNQTGGPAAAGDGGLGQVIVFVGSRGGVGATTTAVGCAWLLAEDRAESTALLDLDLHFGTVALKLDTDPGSGLYEALEQPSRIDSLFIDRAMVKVTDNLRVLATEASAAQHLMIDAGAIDMLLYELRRKFTAGRGRSAAGRHPSAAGHARRGGPCGGDLGAQSRRVARHDPIANPDARTGAAGSPLAGRGRRQRKPRADRQGRI
jgi:pilus assembly protein CpaE